VLGQALPQPRLLGFAFASFLAAVAIVPAAGHSDPGGSITALRAENDQIAAEMRSTVLELYSLDAQLGAAQARVDALHAQAQRLRAERARLVVELKIARRVAAASERQLVARLVQLYEQGSVSPIEIVLGARSLGDALTQLDDMNRLASVNGDVIAEVHAARTHLVRTSTALAARSADLRTALADATAAERSLAQTRAARAAYVSDLGARRDLNDAQISRLEAEAQAAERRAQALAVSVVSTPTVAVPVGQPAPVGGGGSLTVTATGYALPGTTATGIPVGYGVAAVDPRVIPLGTHISVPGYGEAVAADVGGAIVGSRVDLWFPTVAQASAWGLRTVTIAVH
jgi:3D (Asp-Asp-Asp) domain-containing protein/peptidoglycan hydrolase CwlO-like protein